MLYGTRIQPLLDNVASWLPFDHSSPVKVRISNGFSASLEIALRPYVPIDENALTHILFRCREAGMIVPQARSSPFALCGNTLTKEKADQYCDSLAIELALSEGREVSERNVFANHILAFAAARCHEPEAFPRILGVCRRPVSAPYRKPY